MIEVKTAWDRPYRPLQGDHAAAFMMELRAGGGTGKIPVHLFILLDISGSMNDDNKLVESKRACEFIIDSLSEEDFLSLMAFHDRPLHLVQQIPATAANKDEARRAVEGLGAVGVTRLEIALEEILQQTGPQVAMPTFIILISDGRPTDAQGVRVQDLVPYYDLAESLGRTGAKVIAVALGDPRAYEADFFNMIAQRTGGPFRYSPQAGNLQAVIAEDLRGIQLTALDAVSVDFSFYQPSTKLLKFGRAYPDKQFFDLGLSFHLGALPFGEPHIYLAYIQNSGTLDSLPGQVAVGQFTLSCHTPAGPWSGTHDIVVEYTDNPEYLVFENPDVKNRYLDLMEGDFIVKGIQAEVQGDQAAANRHMQAAIRTRKERTGDASDLEQLFKTKRAGDPGALPQILEEARKSRRPGDPQ